MILAVTFEGQKQQKLRILQQKNSNSGNSAQFQQFYKRLDEMRHFSPYKNQLLYLQLFDARLQLARFQYSIQLSILSTVFAQRYMKGNRINYFESPRPTHFNETNLLESRYHHSDDQDAYEERIFVTPIRLNTQLLTSLSPMRDPHLISSQPRARLSQDFFCESGTHNQNQQQYLYSHHGINQKLQFSEEEELLKPITPQKVQRIQEGQQPGTTIRKPNPYCMTPLSQPRNNERGLRRLASEAYRFVTQQKKTTYKEVAKRLIAQMGDDTEMDINKKGQSNIKRRVYDALNVLIALGVLKRNGNRILCKKVEHSATISNQSPYRQQKQMKEEQMEIQLAYLRQQYEKRLSLIEAKRKHLKEARTKIEQLKVLQDKNQSQHKVLLNQNKITFPLVALCLKDNSQTLLKNEDEMLKQQKEGTNIKLWQEGQGNLYCSFNSTSNVDVMGQLDLVLRWQRGEQKQGGKNEKVRRKKRT